MAAITSRSPDELNKDNTLFIHGEKYQSYIENK